MLFTDKLGLIDWTMFITIQLINVPYFS